MRQPPVGQGGRSGSVPGAWWRRMLRRVSTSRSGNRSPRSSSAARGRHLRRRRAGEATPSFSRVEQDGVTVLETVPTLLDLMLAGAPDGVRLPRLPLLISNAETLAVPLCRRWCERFPRVPLCQTYGATECSDDVTHRSSGKCRRGRLASGGGAADPRDAGLRDRQRAPAGARRMPGQLAFAGAGVGAATWATRADGATFVPDPFAAGPGGASTGQATWGVGRRGSWSSWGGIDHQVKVRGFRVEPVRSRRRCWPLIRPCGRRVIVRAGRPRGIGG